MSKKRLEKFLSGDDLDTMAITRDDSHSKNVSGYVCNHGSLRVGNETLRPLGVAMGNIVSVTRV